VASSNGSQGMRPWRTFASVYRRLGPPLRPSRSDVDRIAEALPAEPERLLLLGVTPELSVLGRELTAVDNSPKMLADVWPGDRSNRRAMIGDWTDLPFADSTFDAVIGDGCLNSAPDHVEQVLDEAARVISLDGRFVIRAFCAPAQPACLSAIENDPTEGGSGNFHALKWRIAMALAPSRPRAAVLVSDILAAFNAMFPDRSKLASECGWSLEDIATIDAYEGADHKLGFPTLASFVALSERSFSHVRVIEAAGYPLAERCPTIACTK
jgi:SAM-dependent methyltransferase